MKREGWICLIGIAISRLALAVPEAQIELSIYDLIPKKVDPSISANYAAEVASKIESNKEHLVACFKPGTLGIENYFAQIRITPFGMAQPTVVTQDEKQAQDPRSLNCLVSVLSSISFPHHSLKSDVIVKLPLLVQKEAL